jgi:hypothetical protein
MPVLFMRLEQVTRIIEPQVIKHSYQITKSRLAFIQEVLCGSGVSIGFVHSGIEFRVVSFLFGPAFAMSVLWNAMLL